MIYPLLHRYRTILERALSMRLVYAERNSNRQASFEFLNRQMVWHAFTVRCLVIGVAARTFSEPNFNY
jgi:hypothetical protein